MDSEVELRSEGSRSGRSSSTEEENGDEIQHETTNPDDHSDVSSSERNDETEDDRDRDSVVENGQDDSYSSGERNSEDDEEKDISAHPEPSRTSSRMSETKSANQNESNSPTVNNTSLNISEWMEEIKTNLKLEYRVLIQTVFKDYENINELKQVLLDTTSMCNEYDNYIAKLCEKMIEVKGTLKQLHMTMNKKLSEEGLKSWMGDSTNYDLDRVKEKELLEQAAEARSEAGKVHADLVRVLEEASRLEEQSLQARVEAERARTEAEEAARAALEARRIAEEKARMEEEARRKAQEAKRKKEDEERRQREEEERKREEMQKLVGSPEEIERMKKEAERRNPDNWPQWVYSVEPGEIDIPIGCIIRAIPGSLAGRDDLDVQPLDQLDDVFTLDDNEELVSQIIQINPTSGEADEAELEEPLAIAIPHCASRNQAREPVIKQKQPDGQWKELPTNDVAFEDIKEYKFVQARVLSVENTLAVVTRFRREEVTVPKRGCKVTASVDPRVCFIFKQGSYKQNFNISLEIQPVELGTVSDVRSRFEEDATHLISSSPMTTFSLPMHMKKLSKAATVTFPVPPNPALKTARRPGTAAVNSTGKRDKPGTPRSNVNRPKSALNQPTYVEDEVLDVLHLVEKNPVSGHWMAVTNTNLTQTKNKDAVMFDVKESRPKFVILRTQPSVNDQMAERIAQLLEESSKERVVHFILRQRSEDPRDVIILCTTPHKSDRLQKKLSEDLGYDLGPSPSKDIMVHEGHKMFIRFRGNIQKESEDTTDNELPFVFNSHIRTKQEFSVIEVDRFAQKSIDCFRGFAQVCYTKRKIKETLLSVEEDKTKRTKDPECPEYMDEVAVMAELLINIPKPEPEAPKPVPRAPVHVKTDGLIDDELLRYVAGELGDEWRRVGHYLNVRRVRIQAIMRNNANDQENAVMDMLLTWAKKVPRSVNKADVLCYALGRVGRVDLVEEIRDREDDYKRERAITTRDSFLRKAFMRVVQNSHIVGDWKFLARQLGLSEADLGEIEEECTGLRDRCLRSMVRWRNTIGKEATVELLAKHLKKCRYTNVAEQVKSVY